MECLFIVSLPPNALYSVSCIIANLFFCSQHFFLDNLYYLFVSWSQQAFSGVLYYSGAFFLGGGVSISVLLFLHDILLYSGCPVCFWVSWFTNTLFRYITLCLTKWPILFCCLGHVTFSSVSLSRRVSWVSYLMFYTIYLLIHMYMYCMYYCCCWIFFSIQSTTLVLL